MNLPRPSIKIGAGAIIVKDGKTLMTKRKLKLGQGTYGTVGGHVEYGETPLEAAKREAMEELGIELGNFKFLCCTNLFLNGQHYIDISFTADIVGGEPAIRESDSIELVGWYDLDNLPQPMFGPVATAYEAYKTGQSYFEL